MPGEAERQTRKQRIDPRLRLADWRVAPFTIEVDTSSWHKLAVEEYEIEIPLDSIGDVRSMPNWQNMGSAYIIKMRAGVEFPPIIVMPTRRGWTLLDGVGYSAGRRFARTT
jgi:hypothetical protein